LSGDDRGVAAGPVKSRLLQRFHHIDLVYANVRFRIPSL
jgi:hypothetical protein